MSPILQQHPSACCHGNSRVPRERETVQGLLSSRLGSDTASLLPHSVDGLKGWKTILPLDRRSLQSPIAKGVVENQHVGKAVPLTKITWHM